jgi:hypothetical protein
MSLLGDLSSFLASSTSGSSLVGWKFGQNVGLFCETRKTVGFYVNSDKMMIFYVKFGQNVGILCKTRKIVGPLCI